MILSWIMWKLLKPLDWLIERLAVNTKQEDEPKKELPQVFSHVAWSTLTETGPLGQQYVASRNHGWSRRKQWLKGLRRYSQHGQKRRV